MVQTISMDALTKNAESIYEAIIMIARRARQINDDNKVLYEREYYDDGGDDFIDDDFEPEINRIEVQKLPKPATTALGEFLEGDLEKNYLSEDD